jgi:hypothetical protein
VAIPKRALLDRFHKAQARDVQRKPLIPRGMTFNAHDSSIPIRAQRSREPSHLSVDVIEPITIAIHQNGLVAARRRCSFGQRASVLRHD